MADARINYPSALTTDLQRFRYVTRMAEMMRLQHNATTAKILSDAGLTTGKIPLDVMRKIRDFQRDWEAKHAAVCVEICAARDACPTLLVRDANGHSAALLAAKQSARLDTKNDASILASPLLAIGEKPGVDIDPYEDFTAATKEDTNGRFTTLTANSLAVTSVTGNEHTWLSWDKGAGHFGDTFTHLLQAQMTGHSTGSCNSATVWAVSNTVEERWYWYLNSSQAALLKGSWQSGASSYNYGLERMDTYAQDNDNVSSALYYIKVVRGGTSLVSYEYDDSARTNLIASQTVTLATGRTYRYLMSGVSSNSGTTETISYTVANMDIQEAAAGVSIPILMSSQRRWRL
jgi:hypothetical protein